MQSKNLTHPLSYAAPQKCRSEFEMIGNFEKTTFMKSVLEIATLAEKMIPEMEAQRLKAE